MADVVVYGIRHHGPGCARSLRQALEAWGPDVVLIEGPPDADGVIPLVAHDEMRPPVALLVYPSDAPEQASFYPFAVFSPEWQALSYAVANGVAVRFMDLPVSHRKGRRKAATLEPPEDDEEPDNDGEPLESGTERIDDPLGVLAEAAGYTDRELWWEHQVEQRLDPQGLFEGILEAMTALREHARAPRGQEAMREAWMRRTIRAAEKEGAQRIAVVCGAWHAPALNKRGPKKDDDGLLRGLTKRKTTATWIPWTNDRLSYASGYGAGVASPGYYAHLFESQPPSEGARSARGTTTVRWVSKAAALLRSNDLDTSSAHVIEAVRLAEALAGLRDQPMPGLNELDDALLAVLGQGDDTTLSLIRRDLVVGSGLGTVPEGAPQVPLQRDLEAHQKRLRLKPTNEIRALTLDLRKETDREKSRLLHRLNLLEIPWGQLEEEPGSTGRGSFRESFRLEWTPELAVEVVEACRWGNTVVEAATARAVSKAADASLDELTNLLDACVIASLPEAVRATVTAIQRASAVTSDALLLMRALPPLARVARYGDVRATEATDVMPIIVGLFERLRVGVRVACRGIDDDAASAMVKAIDGVTAAIGLLDGPRQPDDSASMREAWFEDLTALADDDKTAGLIQGRACRQLLEGGRMDALELSRRVGLALSVASEPSSAAAWVEGLVRGSGLLLVQHDSIWRALDQWVASLNDDVFGETLPLLRRAFSDFGDSERRAMGRAVRGIEGDLTAQASSEGQGLDPVLAGAVLPALAELLGVVVEPARVALAGGGLGRAQDE